MTGILNRLLDRTLGVDRVRTLNEGSDYAPASDELAAKLKRALDQLRGEAFDEESQSFDYTRVRASRGYARLRDSTLRLREFDPKSLIRREERIAFWINLYNALIVDAVITLGVQKTVTRDLGFFRRAAYQVCNWRFSADDIEHGVLRENRPHPLLFFPQFASDDPRLVFSIKPMDPRVHAALNCASRSCPPISVYDADLLDEQLDHAMRAFVGNSTRVDRERRVIHLSRIFQWYAPDFDKGDVIRWLIPYISDRDTRAWLMSNHKFSNIQYSRYDWSLNSIVKN